MAAKAAEDWVALAAAGRGLEDGAVPETAE